MATDFDASDPTHIISSNLSGNTSGTILIPDYSDHFNLLNDLVERIAIAIENISAKTNLIEQHLDQIKLDHTIISAKQTIIAAETVTIDDHLNRIQSVVDDTTSSCSTGPHFRMIGGGCAHDAEISRAMMVTNMKKTGTLNEVIQEIENPTPLGHLPQPHDSSN